MTEEKRPLSPAYLSATRLEKVLSLISARSMTSLNPDYFLTHSFSSSDANLAVASLRFLGLIDADSNSTSLMAKMGYKGDAKAQALVEMVKTSYEALLKVVPEACTMGKDELHNDFMHVYKISSRVATGAVPAFVYLCEQAGLREVSAQIKTPRIPSNTPTRKPVAKAQITRPGSKTTIATDSEHTVIPFGKSGISLILPKDILTNIGLLDDYKALISSVTGFSDKYSKTNGSNENGDTESTGE